ncbi:hypothetical protein LEP1GSC161_2737 [Leptospira santarosai str. CBC1416]|uniref:Uncharacterized protein n=1 Tax=Leptospira santarosai str. CBC1416 TaxID=1193059 RepID=M6VNN2_9LEPT|nr:hypothetical protein LEP1GSC071_0294 [Leptospira santarosai str. JET]EMO58395.1 hypothetical protein LEP1GSC161_2737 [Leptospira santarosai str. CBC1416]
MGEQACVDKKARNRTTRKNFPDKDPKKIEVNKKKLEFKLMVNLEY